MKRTLIFDTETTGLIDNSVQDIKLQPHIIEFYGCIVNSKGAVLEELEFMCNPGIVLPKIIIKITGITDADLANKFPFCHHAKKVRDLLLKADSIVAHNLSYDFAMVNFGMQRCGLKAPWPLTRICTVEETEWYKGHRLSLDKLYVHLFGEEFKGAHRAKGDVQALTRCFNELRNRGDV